MPRTLCLLLVTAVAWGGAVPTLARTAPPGPTGDPLEEMSRSLREIVGLLQELRDARQVDQLMSRIALQREGLGPAERQLQDLRAQRDGASEELEQLAAEMRFLSEAAEEEPEDAGSYDIGKRQLEIQMELLRDKLARLDQRVLEAEMDLGARQARILDWEEILDDALGLR
ncbi:MAG: hypothetical protein PVF68_06850 [Acidobacteriota bacterium]|jgi:chromosome segregation ATPase